MFLTPEIVGATESTKAQKNSVEKKHRWSVRLEQSKLGKRHKMQRPHWTELWSRAWTSPYVQVAPTKGHYIGMVTQSEG